jgi:hypothetical protein
VKTIAASSVECRRTQLISDFFAEGPALRVRISRSRVADLQWPLISLERWRPRGVGSRDMVDIRWFRASIAKQRGNKAQRIHFGAQAGQIHLFFSQHFVYVFHGHQGGPATALK